MAPLILHNVPDEELYIGDDGIKRPYAMVFPQQDGLPGARTRRGVAETGSFGKSTRRSRSRTGTPARRENPTVAAADKLFGDWVSAQAANNNLAANTNTASTVAGTATSSNPAVVPQRKTSGLSQPPLLASAAADDTPAAAGPRVARREPTEVILRGYRSPSQQYAAIAHYEQLAGRICEDYSREPPLDQRRYKSELRDPAFTRSRTLTAEERAKVNRADGGEHWVKVTFDSADAADAAIYSSPQRVLGYLVYAELYHGYPPSRDEPIPDVDSLVPSLDEQNRSQSVPAGSFGKHRTPRNHRTASKSASNPFASNTHLLSDLSPPNSLTSSNTLETATISNATTSSATVTEAQPLLRTEDSIFCRRIPTARRAKLLPAEQALLPQQSYTQRVVNAVPFLKWFSGSMIGNEVPRTDNGDFDWNRASLYWKIIWWLDMNFGLFGGEILSADKDD
ncbi:Nucleoporin NUP53 [Colletotrichum chlorophyti]|uniref:Nucleoporin NUP53 n=1 Tax=Colletotrichum chlorophyti TaxID=708187 RepID=A0A1Q8S5G2_9PEZI|nr:Nucleoporin NUP53 [Colletotrichum chlorophyti]